jgi:hypothetical protein
MRRAIVIFAIVLLEIPSQRVALAQAQGFLDLQGVRSVSILIESLNDDAKKVGIGEQMLSDRVLVALKSKAPTLKYDTTALPTLYIRVTVLVPTAPPQSFAASLSLELERPVEILVGQDHVGQTPTKRVWDSGAVLWQHGMILTGPSGEAPNQVGNALDQLLESFFADWYRANP